MAQMSEILCIIGQSLSRFNFSGYLGFPLISPVLTMFV